MYPAGQGSMPGLLVKGMGVHRLAPSLVMYTCSFGGQPGPPPVPPLPSLPPAPLPAAPSGGEPKQLPPSESTSGGQYGVSHVGGQGEGSTVTVSVEALAGDECVYVMKA